MLNDEETRKAMVQYALFKTSASRGANISPMVSSGRVSYTQLTDANKLDVLTYQFRQRWLSLYKMEDISWIVCQFPELGNGREKD